MSLSRRGAAAQDQPLRADLDAFFEALDDRYAAADNPRGKFTLTIAENALCWPELDARFRAVQRAEPTPEWVPGYTDILGAPELRQAVCGMLHRHLGVPALDPERMVVAAGAAAVIEMSALLLADAGDVAVIPGPAYMAYTPDIGNKAGVARYDLHPAATPAVPFPVQFAHTVADLDRARAELGDRFRMLILTQPNNPSGQIFSAAQLRDFAAWCVRHRVHMIVNEIYAFSRLDRHHPDLADDYAGAPDFVSFLPLVEEHASPYLHWWYSLSKDFGVSGFRLGMLYSRNADLLKAWGNIGSTSMSSNHSQWLAQRLLEDDAWLTDYFAINRRRLTASYALVVRTLRRHGVAYAPAAGSLFVWFDLGHLLGAPTDEGEMALWQRVYDETGILLTSPVGQGSPRRGWYRMVYSCVPLTELTVAMQRLSDFLAQAGPA